MRKFLVKSILSLLFAALFISVIFSFFYVVIENRSVILKSAGIYLKDDCQLKGFSGFSCSFVSISNRKDFFLNLKNVNVKLLYRNILRNKPVFDVHVERVDSFLYGKEKKEKKTKKTFSLKGVFYYLRYFNTQIDSINFDLIKKGITAFRIKDFSLYQKEGKLKTLKKAFIDIGKNHFVLKNISGNYDDSSVYIKSVELSGMNSFINGSLNFDIKNNLTLNGKGSLEKLSLGNLFINKANFSFFSNGNLNEKISGKVFFYTKKVKTVFDITNIKGKITFQYKDFLSCVLTTNVESVLSKVFSVKNILFVSYFSYKENFNSKNTIVFKKLSYLNKKLENVVSAFDFSFKGFPYLKGKVFYKKIRISYLLDKKRVLKLSFPEYTFSEISPLIPAREGSLKYISGKLKGEYSVDIKRKRGTGIFRFRELNIYGLFYKTGLVKVVSVFPEKKSSFDFLFEKKSSFVKGKGSIKEKKLNAEFSFKNLDIKNLVFTSKHGIAGLISGNGYINGTIPDIKISLKGSVDKFSYKKLVLRDLGYTAFYGKNKLTLQVKNSNESLKTDINVSLKPFILNVKTYANNTDLKPFYPFLLESVPSAFKNIKPLSLTGSFDFSMKKNNWELLLDVKKGKVFIVPIGDFIYTSAVGKIKNKKPDLKVSFYKKHLKFKNLVINSLNGLFKLVDKKGNLDVELKGLNKAKIFHIFSAVSIDLKKSYINGDVFSTIGVKDYKTVFNTNITGNFKNIKGIFYTELFFKGKKFAENFAKYQFKIKKDKYTLDFTSDTLDFFFNSKFEFIVENPEGKFVIDKKGLNGKITVKTVKTYQNRLLIFETVPVSIYFKNNSIFTKNLSFKGMVSGKIYSLIYNIPEESLILKSDGSINKQILSEFIQFGTFEGSLKYSVNYRGKILSFINKVKLSLFSKDLKLRSSYLRGIMHFDRFSLSVQKGTASIDVNGKVSSVLSGDNYLKVNGTYNLRTSENRINLSGNIIPIRYPGIFEGNITPKIVAYTQNKKGEVKQFLEGKILVSGRLKLEKDIQNQFSKGGGESKKEENTKIKETVLNIKGKTFSPIYVYGSWGNAYMEGDVDITGTLGKPSINGYINVVYGKINYLKNRYNIDFAKLKIIENEMYISARLSTVVANTFIYINVNGNIKNPKLTFTSIPPKSQNEILSILLLKDTPATLENIPLFSVVGKLFYMFLPFGTEEDEGLFNTGFTVMINPSYNPLYGITASIYARKNLTKRFYIAFSRPIKEVEGINIFGWYEIGINITEKTSLQLKWFENQDKEIQLMFSLPFDF